MRHGMWEKVAKRSHKPAMIYSFGKGTYDVMLHGTVDYDLKDGKSAQGIEWAARARLAAEHGSLKMEFYQVYLVCFRPRKRHLKYADISSGHGSYDRKSEVARSSWLYEFWLYVMSR